MNIRTTIGIIIAAALAAPGAASDKPSKQMRQLLAMVPADFAKSAEVKDDSLEVQATITTQPGFQEKRGLLKIVWNDNFLRAFVDKTTGEASYQLYQRIVYTAPSWKFYKLANYETPAGPRSVPALEIGRDVDCTSSRLLGGCTYTEVVAVPIDAALLKEIAARYQPGATVAWRFKFKAQSGEDFNDGMVAAEIAGMLQAVDAYRSARQLAAKD